MGKLLLVGILLIVFMLAIWVVWGEVIAARILRERRLDDEGLRGR